MPEIKRILITLTSKIIDDILFIDDRQDNIDMAKEFGWNTLKASGLELEKIKECCENFIKGVNING